MSDWSLRLARPEDAEVLPSIELSAGAVFRTVPDLADIADQPPIPTEEYRRLIAKRHSLVALAGGNLVGFIATEPFGRELHVVEISVHDDHQGCGIGAGLMRAIMIDARNCGFSAITLTTFRDLPWNEPFYRGLGFVEVEDIVAHPRLADELNEAAEAGLPRDQRCAMIYFVS